MPADAYSEFLDAKRLHPDPSGPVGSVDVHESIYPFQAAIVRWAVRRGRAAIFADCGLGKTRMQVDWLEHIVSDGRGLIVAPLAVAEQTIAEAAEMGVEVLYCTSPPDADDGMWITNYERLHNFVGSEWAAIVLDESSILKSLDGKTRTMLLNEFTGIPFRLCCTATPAPNDISELGNHAQFLGVMSRTEMLASFFVHDSDTSAHGGWRLKGHAQEEFWRWMVSWSLYVRSPTDIGYEDSRFDLPPISFHGIEVKGGYVPEGMLFSVGPPKGITERGKARRASMTERVDALARHIRESDDEIPWVVWCGLNDEGRLLASALGDDAVLIEGADKPESRVEKHSRWIGEGGPRVMVTKPSIFGWGMNWQHCSRVAFLGMGDSYESYYQAIRRCWRFGQESPVEVWIVTSDVEAGVVENVKRKEKQANELSEGIVRNMRELEIESVRGAAREQDAYEESSDSGNGWRMLLGDCVTRMGDVPDKSVGLTIFSPPFASLYTYSASDRDLGNCTGHDEFFEHYRFLISELLRVTMPCRRCCVHVQQLTTTKAVHGVIGWVDFRARVVAEMVAGGFIYDGEVVIDKDPQAQAIRTKSKQLMFVQKNKDSAWSRPAMADYILLFRAPGENLVPVKTDCSNEEWIKWARPIWYDIRESETLNAKAARSEKDERHICPLQLETIRRCVRLWSNPGEMILSPFAGIGSEGYEAIRNGRRFTGIELKPEYFKNACSNLQAAVRESGGGLFDHNQGSAA